MKRKSLLFLLFLALGLPWAANAQETLTVCDGTTTNGKIPVNGLYVDTQGTTSEFIIPATTEGMSDMEGGTVSKLTFYVPNPPATWGSPTIQLYIGEVEYTTLSTLNGPTNFTVVATGVWDNTQTTIEVEFVTPYTYEGGNLLIGTYVQTKSSTYKTTNFAGVSAESGSSMYNNGSGSGTAQSFLPKTTFTYTPGGGSICEKPATMETSNVTSNSAILTWTGGSGTYNLEYKLASAEDWTSLLTNTTATTYTLQDLNPDKAYQARVQSVCGEDVSGWKSVNFRTSFAIPLIEEFGTSIPTGWAMYTGLLENVIAGTAELTSTTYGWNFGEGNGVFDNHAYVNIYGSNCQKWLVMPTVNIEDSIQLQFDMALTAYNSNMPEPSLTGIDDKFIVLINDGSNWTILRQWDNAGSEYVYNDIASTATGQTVSIDLSSYSGQQVAVAFYGESTESNADNNLHIDNVNITRVNATDMYIVTVSANPANGGMVSGGGEFAYGQTCTITATSTEVYSFVNWTENDEIVSTDATYSFTVSANRTLVANFIYDGGGSGDHTYVDLGLPSGLLWATCNVGAETPEDYGDYFAWGETQPKDYYDWSIYQYCMGSNTTLTKYCSNSSYGYNGFTDNLTILLPEDDAATANWGNDWRMPTKEEFEELYNNTTVSWTTQNGVDGRLFVAANGNTLFLPATGYRWNGELYYAGSRGNYWSSSLYTVTSVPDIACQLYFTVNSNCQIVSDSRDGGQPVRPVRSSQNTSFIIDATANPTEGGTVIGSGTYFEGSLCTVTATPADGYYFMNWTQGGTVVSSTATYSFVVEANVDLVANFAEGIYIGDGGNATSQYLPSYSYYNYSLTQQIYTAEEIGTSGMITSIAFFNGGAEKTRTYDFYMKHTTKSNFSSNTDWITVSPSDMVFSGSVTMVADGWTMITFDTPFIYDGTSNVVLVVDDNSGEWTSSPHMSCRVFDAVGPQAIYVYQDGTNFAPMSPPTSSTSNNDVLSVKNQIILGLGSASDFYVISATANPAEGGTVTGTGTFAEGATCTLTATPANGYEFLNWNENNQVVSVDAMYSFTVEGNRDLVANFGISIGTVTASYHPDPMNPESPYVMVSWGTNTDSFEAQIGESTSTMTYFPFHALWKYSIGENLFLASELYEAGVTTAPMTSLSWYVSSTSCTTPQNNISIWMANVSDTELSSISHTTAGMTLVYTGNNVLPLAGQWNEFIFNQGNFSWDGHSNILILCTRNNDSNQGSISWQTHNPGFTAMSYHYSDTNGGYDVSTTPYTGLYTSASNRANIMFKSSINRENSVTYKVYRTDCDGNNYSLIADNVTSPFVDSLWLQLPVGSYQYGVSFINDEEIVASNCIDKNLYTCQITATPNFEERGIVTGAGTYPVGSICTLSATANSGYIFVNWTKDNIEVSTEATYSFTVTENATYVANFIMDQSEVTQENTLAQGYNWWSTYIEQEGINGLEMLENSLGGNGVAIRSQASGYTDYYGEDYGWWGSLTSINNESSYRVVASTPCTVSMTGIEAVPSQHPITLNHGWTWMGYVPSTAMDVNTAMAGLEASNGDMLKSQQGYADYYPNYGWYGSLNTIEPGMGLMYYSTSGETVIFTYPDNTRNGELKKNLTAENNHWKPNTFAYPDNMTVMAVVELNEMELKSDNYELAAFAANGECLGSVRLNYAEPLHRHVAFLTISGKDAAELSFRLYDTETGVEYYDAEESLDFVANAIVGDATDLYVVHFRGTTGVDELANRVKVYPNPVNRGEQFSIGLAETEARLVRVEIVNALGAIVSTVTSTKLPASLVAPETTGVYTIKIIVDNKVVYCRMLVVR